MDKSKTNFLIDAVMFICMMAIAGIGFLMKFVLIPGKERWIKYGRNVDLYLFGLDRHEWGTVHLIVGLVLLGLLFFHIVLHWGMVVNIYRRLVPQKSIANVIAILFVIPCIIFILIPFFLSPEVHESMEGKRIGEQKRGMIKKENNTKTFEDSHFMESRKKIQHPSSEKLKEIRGNMTLGEVALRCSVPIEYLKEGLGIPLSASNDERLGQLKKQYGFRMSDLRRLIDKYEKNN